MAQAMGHGPTPFEAAEPAPEPLPVSVTRDGSRVTVSIDVPTELEDEWAGQLVLLLNSPAGPPEAHTYDITRAGSGVTPTARPEEGD